LEGTLSCDGIVAQGLKERGERAGQDARILRGRATRWKGENVRENGKKSSGDVTDRRAFKAVYPKKNRPKGKCQKEYPGSTGEISRKNNVGDGREGYLPEFDPESKRRLPDLRDLLIPGGEKKEGGRRLHSRARGNVKIFARQH